jgi:hypothetical protein
LDPQPITVDEAIDDYVFTEEVVTGEHYELEDSDFFPGMKSIRSGIASFFGLDSFLGKSAEVLVKETEEQDFVELGEYLGKTLFPEIEKFEKSTRTIATKWAAQQTKAFKASFVGRLAELDAAIKSKLEELESALSDARKTEGVKIANENNLRWLVDFAKRLDEILAV